NEVDIGHVEPGLRTYNKYSPFPEEMNRQMTGVLADLRFSPTDQSKENLLKENKDETYISVTGNTASDAHNTTDSEAYKSEIMYKQKDKKVILLTAHRRENIGMPMEIIFSAVREIVEESDDVTVVYPIHKNPKVREIAAKYLSDHDRIEI